MSTYILTSMFNNGFSDEIAELFQKKITQRERFAFVASEFKKNHRKTDKYFKFFLNMFEEKGIHFKEACVVDSRMTAKQAQSTVEAADVVWLSGGNTPVEFAYLQEYGLAEIIKNHSGVVIGMSAGSINLADTAICTRDCEHDYQQIYPGLGCVRISVEPHFVLSKFSDEILELSENYVIYGLCDESVIVCEDGNTEFYGEIYKIEKGNVERV